MVYGVGGTGAVWAGGGMRQMCIQPGLREGDSAFVGRKRVIFSRFRGAERGKKGLIMKVNPASPSLATEADRAGVRQKTHISDRFI